MGEEREMGREETVMGEKMELWKGRRWCTWERQITEDPLVYNEVICWKTVRVT